MIQPARTSHGYNPSSSWPNPEVTEVAKWPHLASGESFGQLQQRCSHGPGPGRSIAAFDKIFHSPATSWQQVRRSEKVDIMPCFVSYSCWTNRCTS
jgi:hypothetical protein